jgi:putative endonuclease
VESPIVERWRLGASLWKAFGGEALAVWWQDLWDDPLSTPIALGEATKDDIGRWGEDLAVHYLRRQEMMKILKRNFRAPQGGEVDVVCRHGDTLVFVEVKTRTSTYFGRPISAVDAEKEQLIARGALDWLHLLGKKDVLFRFDVIEIILTEGEPPDIQRVENAFELPDNYYMPG